MKLRPTEVELKDIGANFEVRWKEFSANAPDKPALYFGPLAVLVGDASQAPPRRSFTVEFFFLHPASLGYIHITSGEDVNAPPDFEPAYLTKPEDLALLVWAYKCCREFARRMSCYRGEFSSWHPKFPEGSEAVCREDAMPVPVDAPDIK